MTRFSQLYLTGGEPRPDSIRFRNRLSAYFSKLELYKNGHSIAEAIEVNLGIKVPYLGRSRDLDKFFRTAEIRDILDTITIVWNLLKEKVFYSETDADTWKNCIEIIFKEENLGYRIDNNAIVHYLVDVQFERERAETLRWLSSLRFSAIKREFELAYTKLSESSPDTKSAVRSIFESLEILIKLQNNGVQGLTANDATRVIKPKLDTMYLTDNVAKDSANQILKSFTDWINAAHLYRHGQAVTEPSPPPLGLAILMVAQGTAFLRWLLEIYQSDEA